LACIFSWLVFIMNPTWPSTMLNLPLRWPKLHWINCHNGSFLWEFSNSSVQMKLTPVVTR
jgi:hypothetical protein